MTPVRGPRFALALASISLIGPLAIHLFMPVIPAVRAALGLSEAVAQLTFSVALFVMAFATPVYGSLSDRYGRCPVLFSELCLFLIGSGVLAFAKSVTALVLGRFIQAIGAGCGVTLVRAIAQDVYGRNAADQWRHHRADRAWGNVLRDYVALFRNPTFACFVLQSGFCSASFLVTATAASNLMKEMLHRSSAEFGVYFLLFPFGFLSGNFVTSRVGTRFTTRPWCWPDRRWCWSPSRRRRSCSCPAS